MENNKKPIMIGGAVLLAAVAFMFGSSTNTSPQNANPQPTITDSFTQEPVYSDDESFLASVNGHGNLIIASIADSDLLEMGYQVCAVLDNGYTVEDIVDEFIYSSNLSTDAEFEAVGLIIGSAVSNLCPEYLYMVREFV